MVATLQSKHRAGRAGLVLTVIAAPCTVVLGDDPPEEIELVGVIRDFRERSEPGGHPDFEQTPDGGFGLYAGLVEMQLGSDDKPVYAGPGFRVTSNWTDANGNPIAPHLFNKRWSTVDIGETGTGYTVTLQDADGTDALDVTFQSRTDNADGTSTWTYDAHERNEGRNVRKIIFRLEPTHQVMPGTTGGYNLGTDGETGFFGIRWNLSNAWREGTFTIVLDQQYHGAVTSDGVLAKAGAPDTAPMYVPGPGLAQPAEGECMLVDDPSLNDHQGSSGGPDDGGIESFDSFRLWYRDTPGVNVSALQAITLTLQPDGNYVFDAATDPVYAQRGGFFPIDGMLFGNSAGEVHNFHFTYELHTTFTFHADAGQMFRFTGDDDVWVYIDGNLVIDIGGVHGVKEQFISLDRMCLEDGETYSLDFFFAERHRTQSNFRMTTNIELQTNGMPTISAVYD